MTFSLEAINHLFIHSNNTRAPKVGRKSQATRSKMDHSDEMAAEFVFKKSDQHQQGGCVRRWATREEEATAEQVFFHTPRFEDGFRGGAETPSFKTAITDKDKILAKIIKAAKEGDKEKTEQADGGDRLG